MKDKAVLRSAAYRTPNGSMESFLWPFRFGWLMRSLLVSTIAVALLALSPDSVLAQISEELPQPSRAGNSLLRGGVPTVLSEISPRDFEAMLISDRASAPEALKAFGDALMNGDSELQSRLHTFLPAVARAFFERIGSEPPPWDRSLLELLASVHLLDPHRFIQSAGFRHRVLEILADAVPPERHPELRDHLLQTLNQFIDFESSETIEAKWGAIPRSSSTRNIGFDEVELIYTDDTTRPIDASFYSLPSAIIDARDAEAFLSGLRPSVERSIVVLTDEPNLSALTPLARERGVILLNTYGRSYSPWPRDPFTIAGTSKGTTVLVTRPNLQRNREEDTDMARELLQGLPAELDERWGTVQWAESPVPFHNGKILMTSEAVWIDMHTVEVRNLQLLDLDAVPVSSFGSLEGIDRYVQTSRKAAAELAALYQKPVRFVHPLPETGSLGERRSVLWTIGGGARYDLDSLLTILPRAETPSVALVGDISLGARSIAGISHSDLNSFLTEFGLALEPETAGAELSRAQTTETAAELDAYLDLIAEHLEGKRMKVVRLPLLILPTSLLNDSDLSHDSFLITWNNVVLHGENDRRSAEGFASLLAPLDQFAKDRFREAGYQLDLFPPLVRSVILNGGYRCASNHLRLR